MALQIDIKRKVKGAYIVSPSGFLNSITHRKFDRRIEPILAENIDLLVLDLQNLEYISSAGISSILKVRHAVKKNKGKIRFMNLQPQIRKVLDIVNAIPSIKLFSNAHEMDAYLDIIQQRVKNSGE